jgi:carboxypeptidase C (cathepsin A)
MIADDITHLPQIAGYVQEYATGGKALVYATVRGAGHMVPTDKPQQALEMFRRFISGSPL